MITETFARLEDGTTMTTFSATALSTAWLDLGTVVEDLGAARELCMNIAVTTAATGVGGVEFQLVAQPVTTLAGMSATPVTAADDTVTVTAHGWPAGTPVMFSVSGGSLDAALTAGVTYYVHTVTPNTFKLSTTLANALSASPTAVNLSGAGTGTQLVVVVPQVLGSSGFIPASQLAVGSIISVRANPLPRLGGLPGVAAPFRYIFAKYVETTVGSTAAAVTAGKWIVDLCDAPAEQVRYYASGIPNLI